MCVKMRSMTLKRNFIDNAKLILAHYFFYFEKKYFLAEAMLLFRPAIEKQIRWYIHQVDEEITL